VGLKVTERTGTRERIKQVALELFTEHGYEQTSLREIAERLGVTKAALYYHFKSKEEIVHAFVEDRVAATADMIAWVREQPPGKATRRAFIQRYAELVDTGHTAQLAKFYQENQPALKGMTVGEKMREQMRDLVDALAGPDAKASDKLRAGLSVWVLHGAWFLIRDPSITDDEVRNAALEVAYELTENQG
jgi:AcrR family transcriptional regulator